MRQEVGGAACASGEWLPGPTPQGNAERRERMRHRGARAPATRVSSQGGHRQPTRVTNLRRGGLEFGCERHGGRA